MKRQRSAGLSFFAVTLHVGRFCLSRLLPIIEVGVTGIGLAPRAGFEPATRRLTAVCSTD